MFFGDIINGKEKFYFVFVYGECFSLYLLIYILEDILKKLRKLVWLVCVVYKVLFYDFFVCNFFVDIVN